MFTAILLLLIGAFLALYFSHKSFHDKVNDLVQHVKDLFVKKKDPTDTEPPQTPTA